MCWRVLQCVSKYRKSFCAYPILQLSNLCECDMFVQLHKTCYVHTLATENEADFGLLILMSNIASLVDASSKTCRHDHCQTTYCGNSYFVNCEGEGVKIKTEHSGIPNRGFSGQLLLGFSFLIAPPVSPSTSLVRQSASLLKAAALSTDYPVSHPNGALS